jgi:membrane associated rhomboid family serine protease
VRIPAGSERQALDWSLALASQDIACIIRPPTDTGGWILEVDSPDAGKALRTLRLYHVENRRRSTVFTPAVGDFVFHWGVILWCLLLVMVSWAADAPGSPLNGVGRFDTEATRQGDWWRPLTATFLHAGPDHLASNLTTGFLLLGLAMGRFGVGTALLGTLIAGTCGNLLAWWWRGLDYHGLGASGVVMGAVGMLTVSLVTDAWRERISRGTVTRGLLGGLLLFILLGTSPQSDVLAHLGGLVCGGVSAGIVGLLPTRWTLSTGFDVGCALSYLILSALAWAAALT